MLHNLHPLTNFSRKASSNLRLPMSHRADNRLARILKENDELRRDSPPNCSAGIADDSDFNQWKGSIIGPESSPYEGGIFYLRIDLPAEYPMRPPIVKFTTRIYHPNINSEGSICLDLLKGNWSPAYTIKSVLLSICSMLTDANADDPLEIEIGRVYRSNRAQFEMTAREWTIKFAQN